MANVRIAQIGQTAVNRPFYEIVVDDKKYVGAVNADNNVEIVSPSFLQKLGVNSLVTATFSEFVRTNDKTALALSGSNQTRNDSRFPYAVLGTGFAFVSDFIPVKGWATLVPAVSKSF